jgi:hypothetical protein
MFRKNKRGQASTPAWIFYGIIFAFIFAIVGFTLIGTFYDGLGFVDSFSNGISTASSGFLQIFGVIFEGLLDLKGTDGIQFLQIVSFILVFMVVAATLDQFNLFGENDTATSRILNLVAGVIVSAVGVRFMPDNLWLALTAPSSAFVATILAGIVFVPLAMLTIAAKRHPLLVKAGWIGYIVMFGYILVSSTTIPNGAKLAYVVFIILSGVMMFYDSSVRNWFHREKAKVDAGNLISDVNLIERGKLRDELEGIQRIIVNLHASDKDKADARRRRTQIKKLLKDASE